MTVDRPLRPVNLIRKDGETPVLYLHDDVGAGWWDDNTSKAWAESLNSIEADSIQVRINSVGGDAFAGLAIYQLLKDHPAAVHVIVDGIAASAASIVAMAGDTVTMGDGAMMMIHDASGLCCGNAADMRKTAEVLDVCSNSIAAIYQKRAGGTSAEWRERMAAETWLEAAGAVGFGLADSVDDTVEVDATLVDSLKARARFHPEARAVPIDLPAAGPEKPNPTSKEGNSMTDATSALASGLQARLGLPDDADEGMILAALDDRLNQPAQPAPEAASFRPPEGTTLVDTAQWARVSKAAEDFTAHRHATILDQAERDGRIAPANRPKWEARLQADEAAALEVLDELQPNSAVHTVEVGHAISAVDKHGMAPADVANYSSIFPEEATR
jgi:ATP-dependent protease ClpP protease subunit